MDFLSSRNDSAIRKEIIGIRDSYHHYWDLLAELLQNSRDAITRKRNLGRSGPFVILLSIDPASNSIEILDNGTGIAPELLTEILVPGGGDKGLLYQTNGEVGEKGVGLTYAVFSCNSFSISSKAEGSDCRGGMVLNAQRWLNREPSVERPLFEPGVSSDVMDALEIEGQTYPLDTFTRINVSAILPPEGDVNLFQMTRAQLRLLLRTRTAVGVTSNLFSDSPEREFDVYLSLNTPSGVETEKVDASFIAPHTLVAGSSLVTLQATRDAFVSRGDPIARRRFLSGKTVWSRATEDVDGWEISVYGVMFPDNEALRQLSQSVMAVPTTAQEESEGLSLLENGIFVGTKGMPTGMKIAPAPGGRYPAYYKRCFFFVESPALKFDLGRKSLHYRHVRKLQTAIARLFTRFEDIAPYQGEARVEPGEPQVSPAERRAASEEMWRQAEALPDLNEVGIRYDKHPNDQEAAVAAIFHELVGAGILSSYRTLRTGYSERYDLHARHVSQDRATRIVIEFKYRLEALLRDLSERRKHFSDLDLLVAWDADVGVLARSQFMLDAFGGVSYEGVTHMLTVPIPGIDPIPVILLRTLLDRRRSSN